MRLNTNKKVHQQKRDPFQLVIRLTLILAVCVAAGVGLFWLCSKLVENDYIVKRDALNQQNAEAEVEFNTHMNALRNGVKAEIDPDTGELTPVENDYWDATIDGSVWRIEDESAKGLENTSTIAMDRAALINGGLLLVNAWHPLPSDFTDTELISVGSTSGFTIQVQDNTVRLFPAAYDALKEAIGAAKEAGLEYFIVREAYRSNDAQTQMFEERMQKESAKYSGEILIEQTKKYVNYPGTSDHQTGMSFRLDIYNRNDADLNKLKFQRESEQGKWFTANCWKYGIVFRFPVRDFPNANWEDKSYKTGVSSEINLYRFVGKAHAAAMRTLDYCLEEYVEFLIKHPHICIYQDGALKYEIVRINMNPSDTSFALPVPNPASGYQGSLDNMGGIVMAYTY